MKPAAWRAVLLAICGLSALVNVASVVDVTGMGGAPPWRGEWGAVLGGLLPSNPFYIEVTSVDPGGAAARAGLRRGDLIDIRENTLVDRFSLLGAPLNGRPITLSVRRGSLQKELTVVPRPVQLDWSFWLGAFGDLWLLLFAALIAWRRADAPQMRLLSLWLAVFVFVGAMLNVAAPWAWVDFIIAFSANVAGGLSVVLLAAFAGGFARPLSRPRGITQWICYAFAAATTVMYVSQTVAIITLRFDPVTFVGGITALAFATAAVLMAAVCGVLAIAASHGIERQRAVWTLVPIAVFLCYFIVVIIATPSLSYANSTVANLVYVLVLFAVPVALTYAALSRRLIDIGFVLNRTVVFAALSTIVIGAFVLVEWAASKWFLGASHTTSAIVDMLVALALGLSLRFIHKYVERFVDRVFFRKRNEDEAALRRFAHESSFITDRSVLLERAVREVKEHSNVDDVTILTRDGDRAYLPFSSGARATVSENDPGIVALRAWGKPVDLNALEGSELRGEFAFPMISRGALVGALICGSKRDGEVYAPDESDALLALAQGVGTTLDTLSGRSDDSRDAILEAIRALPDAIADRLRTEMQRGLTGTSSAE